jgi:hypothetical protein
LAKTTLHELLVILRDLLIQLAEAEAPKPPPPKPPPKPRATQPWAPDEPEFLPPPRHLGTLPIDWLRRR